MTILDAMQSASIRLVGRKTSVFFSSQGQFERELTDLANEVAKDCIASEEWQAMTKVLTLTGNGVQEQFDFPADYDRQLLNTDVQDLNNWAWGYEHLTDINEFLYRKARGFEPYPGCWIIYENKFNFYPAPVSGNTVTFPYVSSYYARSSGGTQKAAFTADDDSFALPERLLTLGLVWRWREMKKLDYTGDMEAFQKCIDELMARDKGSKIIRGGNKWRGLGTSVAYPWPLG